MRTTEKVLLCLRNFNCEQFWVPHNFAPNAGCSAPST